MTRFEAPGGAAAAIVRDGSVVKAGWRPESGGTVEWLARFERN